MNIDLETKLPKSFNSQFNVSLEFQLVKFELHKVIEERCDEFDFWLEDNGFELVNREYISIATSIFNYVVIAYSS